MAEKSLRGAPRSGIMLRLEFIRGGWRQGAHDVVSPRRRTNGLKESGALEVAHSREPIQESEKRISNYYNILTYLIIPLDGALTVRRSRQLV